MKIKNKIGGLTLLDFETYYIATVMNTVILVQGQKNQWNRIEFRTDSLFMVNRFLTKVLRMLVKKGNFFYFRKNISAKQPAQNRTMD